MSHRGKDRRTIRKLQREVRELRAHVRRLERSLTASITTGELVVGDARGHPRVRIHASSDHGAIEIVARSREGAATSSVELFATDDVTGSGEHVGVVLARDGDIVAGFEVTGGVPAEPWIDVRPAVEKRRSHGSTTRSN